VSFHELAPPSIVGISFLNRLAIDLKRVCDHLLNIGGTDAYFNFIAIHWFILVLVVTAFLSVS
jgi:hypothetical protein